MGLGLGISTLPLGWDAQGFLLEAAYPSINTKQQLARFWASPLDFPKYCLEDVSFTAKKYTKAQTNDFQAHAPGLPRGYKN